MRECWPLSDLKESATNTQQLPVNNNDKNSIIGTWKANASSESSWRVNNGVASHIERQYTFNADGTYTFISKAFDPFMDKILLGRENGTYQTRGNNIVVIPGKSCIAGME